MTVRARNDGEDFHLLWTARRALRLLDPGTGLVAIRIDGCAPAEGTGPESPTELIIDTAEYYGDLEFAQANRIEYCQLKHSTVQVGKEWTQAELAETVSKFAALYLERCAQYGPKAVTQKLRFVFVTNRPMAAEVQQALAAMVFDGFARGEYRQSIQPRHLHSQGLVQVINELAEQGCCDLVLPDEAASTHNYLKAFEQRLEQARLAVRQRHPGALVLIVLDAADNSEDAAKDRNEGRSFARDLLQRPPPTGCRLVALARTERLNRFPDRHRDTIDIPLALFCEAETGRCVRQSFPEASDGQIAEVHRYTGGNPRIQSYLLKRAGSLAELLRRLGPGGLTVDKQISREVADALKDLRAHAGDEQGIQSLCASLASLPPRVPTRVLALAAEVEQASIESFVAGLGHALIHLDGFVQFRDEPVETWFRETFRRDGAAAEIVLSRLRGLAHKDAYVAAAWPGLLYQADRADELFDHALGPEPKIDDVLERRVIVRERLCFALKLAGQRGDLVTSAKLLLRLGEIRATEERQREILFSNDDLIAALWSPERVRETVYRHRAGGWWGITHARYAAMLATTPGHQADARQSLRQADDWLREWAHSTTEDEDKYREDPEDMAAFARAWLYLEGSEVCCKWLARWVSPDFRFQIARRLAVSLIDRGEPGLALELLERARDEPYLALGLVCALADAGLASSRATLEAIATAWIAISLGTITVSYSADKSPMRTRPIFWRPGSARSPVRDTSRLGRAWRGGPRGPD